MRVNKDILQIFFTNWRRRSRNDGRAKGLTSLDMSEVDTVWTWGGRTSTPPIRKYLIRRVGDTGFERNASTPRVEIYIRCTTTGCHGVYMEYSIIYHKKT